MHANHPDYSFGIASLEIFLMLLGAFLLGMLLCGLLRRLGICCRATVRHTAVATTTADMGAATKAKSFPNVSTPVSGATADINTLLRGRDTVPVSPIPQPAAKVEDPVMAAAVSRATAGVATPAPVAGQKDDLKKLEGIGPRLEKILNAAGIHSYAQLAAMTPDSIRPILEAAGSQFKLHDPSSWPYQAELAAKGEWARLKEYQNLLIADKG